MKGRTATTTMVEGVSEPVRVEGLTGEPNRDWADKVTGCYRA